MKMTMGLMVAGAVVAGVFSASALPWLGAWKAEKENRLASVKQCQDVSKPLFEKGMKELLELDVSESSKLWIQATAYCLDQLPEAEVIKFLENLADTTDGANKIASLFATLMGKGYFDTMTISKNLTRNKYECYGWAEFRRAAILLDLFQKAQLGVARTAAKLIQQYDPDLVGVLVQDAIVGSRLQSLFAAKWDANTDVNRMFYSLGEKFKQKAREFAEANLPAPTQYGPAVDAQAR